VFGPDTRSQSEDAVIRQPNSLFVAVEGHDWQHWSKGFFAHDRHAVVHLCQDSRLIERAAQAGAPSACKHQRTARNGVINMVVNDAKLSPARHRAKVRVFLQAAVLFERPRLSNYAFNKL